MVDKIVIVVMMVVIITFSSLGYGLVGMSYIVFPESEACKDLGYSSRTTFEDKDACINKNTGEIVFVYFDCTYPYFGWWNAECVALPLIIK